MDNQQELQTAGQPESAWQVAYFLAHFDRQGPPEMQARMEAVWSDYNPAGERELYEPVIYALEEGQALPRLILEDGVEQLMSELESNGQPGLQQEELEALAVGQLPGKTQTQRMFATLLAERFHQIEVINDANPLTSPGDNYMSSDDLNTWVMGARLRSALDVLLAFEHDDNKPAYYNEFADKIAADDGITEHDIAELLDQDDLRKLTGNRDGLSSHQREQLASMLTPSSEHPGEPSIFQWLAAMGGDYRAAGLDRQLSIHVTEELAAKLGTSMEIAVSNAHGSVDSMTMPDSVLPKSHSFLDTRSQIMQFADGTHIRTVKSPESEDGDSVVCELREVDGGTWRRDSSLTYRHYDAQGYETGESWTGTIEADEGSVRFFEGDSLRKLLVEGKAIAVPPDAVAAETLEDGTTLIYDQVGNTISAIKLDDSQSVKQTQYRYNLGLLQEVTDSDGTTWTRGQDGLFYRQDQTGVEIENIASGTQFTPPGGLGDLYGEDGMPQFTDVQQGVLGDCGILSTAASIAANNPELIKNMIVDNGDGTFTVTFPGNSDQPITVSAPTRYETSRFAYAREGTAWVAVLEKALRYMPDDGFEIPFLSPSDPEDNATYHGQFTWESAIELMTGHRTELEYFNIAASILEGDAAKGSQNVAEETHEMLVAAMGEGRAVQTLPREYFMLTGLGVGNSAGPIPTSHAYGVVAYDAAARVVTLYNPWGFPGLKYDDPSITANDDGSFSMPLEQYVQLFTVLSVETEHPLSATE